MGHRNHRKGNTFFLPNNLILTLLLIIIERSEKDALEVDIVSFLRSMSERYI